MKDKVFFRTSEASFAIEDQLPKKMQASNLTFHVTEVMTSQCRKIPYKSYIFYILSNLKIFSNKF